MQLLLGRQLSLAAPGRPCLPPCSKHKGRTAPPPTVILSVNSRPSPSRMALSTSKPTILTSPSTVVVTALVFLIISLGAARGRVVCLKKNARLQGENAALQEQLRQAVTAELVAEVVGGGTRVGRLAEVHACRSCPPQPLRALR